MENFRWQTAYCIVILIAISLLAACQSDQEALPTLQSIDNSFTKQYDNQISMEKVAEGWDTTIQATGFAEQLAAGQSGQLLFVQDNTLYVTNLSEAPVLIDSGVQPHLYFSPDSLVAAYLTEVEGGVSLKTLDLQTLTTQELLSTTTTLDMFRWSPSGDWLAFTQFALPPLSEEMLSQLPTTEIQAFPSTGTSSQLTVLRRDGSVVRSFDILPQAMAWLADDTLLVVTIPYGSARADEVLRLFPDSGESRQVSYTGFVWDIVKGISEPQSWRTAQATLSLAGLSLPLPTEQDYAQSVAFSPAKDEAILVIENGPTSTTTKECRPFTLVRQPITKVALPEVVFQPSANDTIGINALSWLADNTFLFALYRSEACFAAQAQGTLNHLRGDQFRVVTDTLSPFSPHPYALSPDQGFVAWIGLDREERIGYLALTNLQNLNTGQLQAITLSDFIPDPFRYSGFQAVYWVAASRTS